MKYETASGKVEKLLASTLFRMLAHVTLSLIFFPSLYQSKHLVEKKKKNPTHTKLITGLGDMRKI